ncbi:hypothetical protein QDY63_10860 [Pseudomonas brenneri]|uniref:hypothetical protein n=1 Tax=Pseudomonas brenneri TaxID=129817 RepID=UPI0025A2E28F|nr:hypothetical protein [Pseudomonas brenneri]WJM93347.1 hypothetical protein QDY63_10860 [Pseudomonas brenneri]
MEVRWAELVRGTERPIGIGVSGAMRCTIRVSGKVTGAILKKGPRVEIVAEAFCAILLRSWGLNVPDSYLLEIEGQLAFASADATYPNLSQRVGLNLIPEGTPEYEAVVRQACHLICNLPSAPLAAVADEAIDNRDRNFGNVLWDGSTEAWIDHAMSLGNGAAIMDDANKLCVMATHVGDSERFSRSALAAWMLVDRSNPGSAGAAIKAIADLDVPVKDICSKLSTMGNRILDRFPAANDLLI